MANTSIYAAFERMWQHIHNKFATKDAALPMVTASNNGQILRVVGGAWAPSTLANAEDNSYGGYTVTLTGTGGYYDDMGLYSIPEYSIDGGNTWHEVFTEDGEEVSTINNAAQIQFRMQDPMFMTYNFYITMNGVRNQIAIASNSGAILTDNVMLSGNAVVEYEIAA